MGHPFSGKFRSTEIERELGDLGTWVILIIARSIFLESFRSFGGLLHQGLTSYGFSHLVGHPFSGKFRSMEIERDLGDSGT